MNFKISKHIIMMSITHQVIELFLIDMVTIRVNAQLGTFVYYLMLVV